MAVFGSIDINRIVEIANEKVMTTGKDSIVYPQTETRASLKAFEVAAINELIAMDVENEYVFGALWSSREALYDLVRAVKNSYKGVDFKGVDAKGDELTMIRIGPQDVKKAGTTQNTWLFTVPGDTDYFESDTNDAKLSLQEYEGRMYVAWADPIDTPKLRGVSYDLPDGTLTFRINFDDAFEFPIKQHPPVKILPQQSWRIQVRYYPTSGDDKAYPIAVLVTKADALSL